MAYVMLSHCREGFETETTLELAAQCAAFGTKVKFSYEPHGAIVVSEPQSRRTMETLVGKLKWSELIFARQVVYGVAVTMPESGDRVAPIMAAINDALLPMTGTNAFSNLLMEWPDTNDGKMMSRFAGKLATPLGRALDRARLAPRGPGARHLPRLHVVLGQNGIAWVGISDPATGSPWPMGIPRLRAPKDAPSRSTLKLEEAFYVFLSDEERASALTQGMRAVDLGAAPGGWTYQLVRRGLHVTAVDNGPMAESLMTTGLVDHVKADAFTWRPSAKVDWLVCDVVEQPHRIAALVGEWLGRGLADRMVFNLKLPMKKRWEEIQRDLAIVRAAMPPNRDLVLRARQLYHDRKEVTCYVGPRQK